MKRLYFCFNFWKKNKENIALPENKKFGKSCENHLSTSFTKNETPTTQPWLAALLGIHF